MLEYPEKNVASRSRRSRKSGLAKHDHSFSGQDAQESKRADGLIENRANGGYPADSALNDALPRFFRPVPVSTIASEPRPNLLR